MSCCCFSYFRPAPAHFTPYSPSRDLKLFRLMSFSRVTTKKVCEREREKRRENRILHTQLQYIQHYIVLENGCSFIQTNCQQYSHFVYVRYVGIWCGLYPNKKKRHHISHIRYKHLPYDKRLCCESIQIQCMIVFYTKLCHIKCLEFYVTRQ